MDRLNIKQIAGFLFAFILVISGIVLLTQGYKDEWGWFLAFGIFSFLITLAPQDLW